MKILVLGSLFLIIACKSKEHKIEQDTFTIDGKWILHGVGDSVFNIKDLSEGKDEFQPYLIFDSKENKIGGYSGCNTFIADAKMDETSITVINSIASTERECFKNWENQFYKSIENLNTYRISYDTLFLDVAGNQKLVFLKADKFEINGNWKLNRINDSNLENTEWKKSNLKTPIIVIDTDKNLIFGTTGCNSFDSKISFTSNGWKSDTRSLNRSAKCQNKIDDEIYNSLNEVSQYLVSEEVLYLTTKSNKKLEFIKIF